MSVQVIYIRVTFYGIVAWAQSEGRGTPAIYMNMV